MRENASSIIAAAAAAAVRAIIARTFVPWQAAGN